MNGDSPEIETAEALQAALWVPSARLAHRFWYAALASLFAGGMAVASILFEETQLPGQGFSLSHAFGLLAFFPLFFAFRAYFQLGIESGSPGLAKSSLAIFVSLFLAELLDYLTQVPLPPGWRIAGWIIFSLGLVAVLGSVFLTVPGSPRSESVTSVAGTPAKDPSPGQRAAGLGGGIAVGFLVLMKALGKGIFLKVMVFRGLMRGGFGNVQLDWEVVGVLGVLGLCTLCLIWFAAAKIRQRTKLGAMAAMLGWFELIGLAVVWASLIGVWNLVANNPGLQEKEIHALTDQWLTPVRIFVDLGWAILTACFFVVLRSRFRPDDTDQFPDDYSLDSTD